MRQILPKIIAAINKYRKNIFPHGFYKTMINLRGPHKEKVPRNPFFFAPGMHDVLATESTTMNKNMINEEINKKIRKSLFPHVNKYMRSSDGKRLQQEVKSLIKMRIQSGKKKVQTKPNRIG